MGQTTVKHLLYGNVAKVVRHGDYPVHRHSKPELYICLGGSATDCINGRNYTVLPGDVYVLSEDTQHAQSNMTDFRCCIFQFDMPLFAEQAASLGLTEKNGFKTLFIDDLKDKTEGCSCHCATSRGVHLGRGALGVNMGIKIKPWCR